MSERKTDWNAIESKWISRWQKEKSFESDPEPSKQKYFVTVAYPYPNSPQHIGHGRTYTLADAHARYMRMRGFNVLFPMGFHYTGTPILGMSRRVASGDTELLETFRKIYGLSDDIIATFIEPVRIASYFHNEIKQGMKEMGYSIDWRREFTTIDPVYVKFISWQFRTMKKKGLIVQGSHPVGWCPRDQNPVSQHDTMGDVEPDFTEYVVIKFQGINSSSGLIFPAATLRPETVFGVTNIWVNPEITYLRIRLNSKEEWLVTKEAAKKLEFLNHSVVIIQEIQGMDLVGKSVTNPLNGKVLPVYPASFVESDSGTGVVMSVPAHAPYDLDALIHLEEDEKTRRKYAIEHIVTAIKIIESDGYGEIPALQAIERAMLAKPEDDRLEKATSNLYSDEFYKGKMMPNTGKYSGMQVSAAKDLVRKELVESGKAGLMYELVNRPVRCRCGAECVVKLLTDQWFLNYGDKHWKELAHHCIEKMDIVPQEIRSEFDNVIDWLKERACARRTGLGTKLPWDPDWIVESLSDSVIYMAYYTMAKYVNSGLVRESNLQDSFFDYVLLGAGDSGKVAKDNNVSVDLLNQIHNEFSYFYPVDSRHSGRDLVPNHLSFFIFNHVAIFSQDKWPRQIVVNGSVLMDGKKMSKSLGNIIPLRAAIKENGADPIRLAMLVSAELLQDADFSFETLRGIKSKIAFILSLASGISSAANTSETNELEDRWLASRLQTLISDATASMEKLRVREAIHTILYSMDQDLDWYLKRSRAKKRGKPETDSVVRVYLETQIRMLAPFAPFTSEEAWHLLGNESLIEKSSWPEPDSKLTDPVAEESEFLTRGLIADTLNIIRVAKISPKKIVIYVASEWKSVVYKSVLQSVLAGKINFGEIMKSLIADPATTSVKSDPNFVKKTVEDILATPPEARNRRLAVSIANEIHAVADAATVIALETGASEVKVFSEEDPTRYDPKSKAKSARPFKPAIYLE